MTRAGDRYTTSTPTPRATSGFGRPLPVRAGERVFWAGDARSRARDGTITRIYQGRVDVRWALTLLWRPLAEQLNERDAQEAWVGGQCAAPPHEATSQVVCVLADIAWDPPGPGNPDQWHGITRWFPVVALFGFHFGFVDERPHRWRARADAEGVYERLVARPPVAPGACDAPREQAP